MKKLVVLSLMVAALSGCSISQYSALAVNEYCALPLETRALNRQAVALAVAPNRIEIECNNDN